MKSKLRKEGLKTAIDDQLKIYLFQLISLGFTSVMLSKGDLFI